MKKTTMLKLGKTVLAAVLIFSCLMTSASAANYAHTEATGATGTRISIYNPYLNQQGYLGPTINNHLLNGQDVFCLDPYKTAATSYKDADASAIGNYACPVEVAVIYAAMYSDGLPDMTDVYNPYSYDEAIVKKMATQIAIFDHSNLGTDDPSWMVKMFGSDSVYVAAYEELEKSYETYAKLPKGSSGLVLPSIAGATSGASTPITLTYNAETSCYEGSATDTNNTIGSYNFANLSDGVTYTVKDNNLTISVPASLVDTLFTSTYTKDEKTFPKYDTNAVNASSGQTKYIDYKIYAAETDNQPLLSAEIKNGSAPAAYFSFTIEEGIIEVHKNSDIGLLEGFEFEVTGPISFTLTTDYEGKAIKTGLIPGTYTVTEKENEIYLPVLPQTEVIGAGETVAFEFTNTAKKVSILSVKTDSQSGLEPQGQAELDGAVYGLYSVSGGYEVGRFTVTGKHIAISGIPLTDSYYLQEISAPKGYELNETQYPVNVDPSEMDQETEDVNITLIDEVSRGIIKIIKTDSDTEGPQGDGSLSGAKFEIYNSTANNAIYLGDVKYEPGDLIETVTTDEDGIAYSSLLPYGTYVIKETEAPQGYKINNAQQEIKNYNAAGTIQETTEVLFEDQIKRGNIIINKYDQEDITGEIITSGQGDATFAGTEFAILNASANQIIYNGGAYNTGEQITTVITESAGSVTIADLPYGTYEIIEVSAPKGYKLNGEEDFDEVVSIYDETTKEIKAGTNINCSDEIETAKITILKQDSEFEYAQGGAKLNNAEFEIVNSSAKAIKFNGELIAPGNVVETVTTGIEGKAETSELPYGTYTIRETKAPEGYLLDGSTEETISLYDGEFFIQKENEVIYKDIVKRGDFTFQKKNQEQKILPNVVFEVTSKTTGEKHYLVTDSNGEINTSASRYLHTTNTNANDAAINPDGTVNEALLDPTAGIWFSGSTDATSEPNNAIGAMPYDIYEVKELRSSANGNLVLLSFEVTITIPDYTVDLGILTDLNPPSIQSVFLSNNNTHNADADEKAKLTETVSLHSVVKDTDYELECLVIDAATGEIAVDAEGNELKQSKTVKAASTEVDNIQFTFKFDATNMRGKALIATDILTYSLEDGTKVTVAVHDLTNLAGEELENQTVSFPALGTTLTDENGNKEVAAEVKTLKDKVDYINLDTTKTYKLVGELVFKDTGKPILSSDGKAIVATKTFKPTAAAGSVEVIFEKIDLSPYEGKEIVCFETLKTEEDQIVHEHKSLNDEDQTIKIPGITTTAKAKDGTKSILAAKDQTIQDEITYVGLEPNAEYELTGKIYRQSSGLALELTESKKFTATDTGSGTVIMEFSIDATSLASETLVIGEILTKEGTIVGRHEDINSEAQSIFVPKILTTALAEDGSKEVSISKKSKIIDTIDYEGLEAGERYTITGTLVDATGAPILTEGEPVTQQGKLKPVAESGYFEHEFVFDSTEIKAGAIVVFEEIYNSKDTKIAEHRDILDLQQTVYRMAELATMATGENGEDKIIVFTDPESEITVKDKILYYDLTPGVEYILSGTLMDGTTETAITEEDGAPITATIKFIPESETGEENMTFTTKAKNLSAKTCVVFQRLYYNGTVIGKHEDISNKDQTVEVYSSAKIFKYDAETNLGLEGAVLTVTDTTTKQTFDATTDSAGYIYFSVIPGHKYTFQEKTQPQGYALNEGLYSFEVKADGTITGDDKIPNIKSGTVIITKVDAVSNNPVQGAEVTIYSQGVAIHVQETDKDGKIYFKPDRAGEYTYKETKAPTGYYINTDEYHFTVKSDMTSEGELSFKDAAYGTIVIKKVTQNGTKLPGATIAFYDASGKKLGTAVTDSDGKVYYASPGAGTYYYIETAAPKGYVRNTKTFDVTINENFVITGTTTIVNTADTKPQTGDDSGYRMWTLLLGVGMMLTTAATTVLYRRKALHKKF